MSGQKAIEAAADQYSVRAWDKDFNLIDTVAHGWRMDEPNVICVPADSKVGRVIVDGGMIGDVHLTVDHPSQERWSGRISQARVEVPFGAVRYIRATFYADMHSIKVLEEMAEWMRTSSSA